MSPTSIRLPSAWPSSSPAPKRCSNAARPLGLVVDAVVGGERDEALAEVAGAEHAEVAPQPTGGAAVVGDARRPR